jgi:hypothetical protein
MDHGGPMDHEEPGETKSSERASKSTPSSTTRFHPLENFASIYGLFKTLGPCVNVSSTLESLSKSNNSDHAKVRMV